MVKIMDFHNSKEPERFWDAYRGCAEENRVRPDRSPFYVRRAKDFSKYSAPLLPGHPAVESGNLPVQVIPG